MPGTRTAVFIDGANLYGTTKALGFDIDFRKLRAYFAQDNLVRINYYTAILDDGEYTSLRPLLDWLAYNGYQVVSKPAKEWTDAAGRRKIKGNLDIEIAVDALELAPRIDRLVLFSGDGDFRYLVEALQRRGVRVVVVSTIQTQPAMIADELRRQADEFLDLGRLMDAIGRTEADRPPPRRSRPPSD